MALLSRKPKSQPQAGKLIVIDGIDGSGKSTQFNLLAETLQLAGYKVQMIKFPRHKQPPAYFVDKYLGGEYGTLDARAASIFYAVDRFDASFQIKQWLTDGCIVLIDRYVTANAGHQGGKIKDRVDKLKYFRWLNDLEHNIFNLPKPDLNIILHMPAPLAQKLVDKRKNGRDRYEDDLEHLKNAALSFVEVSKLFPNTKLVECMVKGKLLTPKQIHAKVWELVRRIALRNQAAGWQRDPLP
jgi:dTMP kinase